MILFLFRADLVAMGDGTVEGGGSTPLITLICKCFKYIDTIFTHTRNMIDETIEGEVFLSAKDRYYINTALKQTKVHLKGKRPSVHESIKPSISA